MSPLPIVADAADLTPEWLSRALAADGTHGRVARFRASPIGKGLLGELFRLELEGEGVPASVVAKFPARDPIRRRNGARLRTYAREVFFYNVLKPGMDVQTPRVYFAACNDAGSKFVILMQDLAPGKPGDPLNGCSLEQAALALGQLAKLHGPRWGDPALQRIPQLGGLAGTGAHYRAGQSAFLERHAGQLTDDCQARVPRLSEAMAAYESFDSGPPGLVHADFRLDNLVFGGPHPVTVLDWQSLSLGCPVRDVSYFLGTSLPTEARRREELHLLRHYLDELRGHGVRMSWDDCLACYRHYAAAGLVMAVIGSAIVGASGDAGDLFVTMANRSSQMVQDLA